MTLRLRQPEQNERTGISAEGPRLSTRIIVEQLRAEGVTGLHALDIKDNNHINQDYMQRSGVFGSVEEVHVKEGRIPPTTRDLYDYVLVPDKSVLAQMDPAAKPAFLQAVIAATAPGGILSIDFYTTYTTNGDGKAHPMVFERSSASEVDGKLVFAPGVGIRGIVEGAGLIILANHRDMYGEKMFYNASSSWDRVEFTEVKHETMIAQRPVAADQTALLEGALRA